MHLLIRKQDSTESYSNLYWLFENKRLLHKSNLQQARKMENDCGGLKWRFPIYSYRTVCLF